VPLPEGFGNLWDLPNLLLQKFPGPAFTATAKVRFRAATVGEKTGLVVMGADYAYAAVTRKADGLYISATVVKNADRAEPEKEGQVYPVKGDTFYLSVKVSDGGQCQLSYSTDGSAFTVIGEPFTARAGRWIGAKVGLFAARPGQGGEYGYGDFDWFRVE
jgi:beta-xylosidase